MRLVLAAAVAVLVILVTKLVFDTDTGVKAADWSIKFVQAAGWQLVVLLAILLVFLTRSGSRLVGALAGRVTKVSGLGFEVDLTEQAAKQAQPSLDEYRRLINAEFDRQVRIRRIDDLAALVIRESVKEVYSERLQGLYRATLHIEDVLFADALYQLVDYYPAGPGRGRAFSIRYGIIGLTWRLRKDQIDNKVSSDERKLIERWSMTPAEAAARRGRAAIVCVLLWDDATKLPVGDIYFDSKNEDAFGEMGHKLADTVRRESAECGLTKALVDLVGAMRSVSPYIDIFQ